MSTAPQRPLIVANHKNMSPVDTSNPMHTYNAAAAVEDSEPLKQKSYHTQPRTRLTDRHTVRYISAHPISSPPSMCQKEIHYIRCPVCASKSRPSTKATTSSSRDKSLTSYHITRSCDDVKNLRCGDKRSSNAWLRCWPMNSHKVEKAIVKRDENGMISVVEDLCDWHTAIEDLKDVRRMVFGGDKGRKTMEGVRES